MTFRPPPGFIPPVQDLETLAAHVCIGASTIEKMVAEKRFPPPRRKKAGKNLWIWEEVYNFLAAPEDETIILAERIKQATRKASHG